MEYLQQLRDEVLAKNITLLADTETFQVIGSKQKEITNISSKDEMEQWSPKKTKGKQLGKYCRNTTVKMGSVNPCEKCIHTRQNCLVYNSR